MAPFFRSFAETSRRFANRAAGDQASASCDIEAVLEEETCSWLTEPVVQWFQETVSRAIQVEFDRYVTAGDLDKTKQRAARLEAATDDAGGSM